MQFRPAALAGLTLTLVASSSAFAQEREDRALLSQAQMTSIINEVSGDRMLQHILELVPYQRVRPPSEYNAPYQESRVIMAKAQEYGFANVAVETFGQTAPAWQPTVGELWMTAPKSVKLFDIHDVALSLASLNANGDFSGDLINVGAGRPEDFTGRDVKGKFVLTSGSTGQVYALAVEKGALGVLGLATMGPQRAIDFPRIIVSSTVNAKPGTVAWSITPEARSYLESLLLRGETIQIRSLTKSTQVPGKNEYVRAEIPGDGSTTQEVGMSCHLYEGVIKQGANDDNSGCGMTLEAGRAYIKLVREGKLPAPKRTINFLFVPEISGTNAYLNKYVDKARRMIGTLNFDMEGIRLTDSRAYWLMHRTPDSYPSYLNDIGQNMMEYVSDITRERIRFRRSFSGYAPTQPVESPHGSKDAFYIKVDKHYGSSDHVTFMQHGIPSVIFNTWPDMWYHSSDDTPDKQDPTQLKRAGVVALGALAALASGTDEMAARILAENIARGTGRMSEAQVKGLGYIADADAASLPQAYREARLAIRHQAEVEQAVIRSAGILWTDEAAGRAKTTAFEPLVAKRADVLLAEVDATYRLAAAQLGVAAAAPEPSEAEREASTFIVKRGPNAPAPGTRGPPAPGPYLPDEYMAEFQILVNRGDMTIMQIRDFLSGQFTPLALTELMATLKAREAAGLIILEKQ